MVTAFSYDRPDDYLRDLSRGGVVGGEELVGFGEASISGAQPQWDVWGGAVAIKPGPVTAGFRPAVVSASANDAAAGSGVRTIKVYYLDTSGDAQTEMVTMNGTTPVNMVATNVMFINCAHSVTVGSYGAVAAGAISFSNGATVMNIISAGGNRCRSAHRMIPRGYNGFISSWHSSSVSSTAAKRTIFHLRANCLGNGTVYADTFIFRSALGCVDGSDDRIFHVPLHIPPLAEVKVSANSAGSCDVVAEFCGWIEPI